MSRRNVILKNFSILNLFYPCITLLFTDLLPSRKVQLVQTLLDSAIDGLTSKKVSLVSDLFKSTKLIK